jgi:hypothetical protein
VALADGDAGAHGRLAAALADAHQDDEAAAEYRKALAGAPGDAEVARGLALAEKRLAAAKHHGSRAHRAARAAGRARGAADDASVNAPAGESDGDAKPEAKPEKSAPAEPASDQQ